MENTFPTLSDRIKSTTIDTIILIACMYLFKDVLHAFENVPNWVRILLFASLLMYEPLCTTFGATLGNHRMDIRVRKSSDPEQRLNILQSIVRFFFKVCLGWLSFITFLFDSRSRAIHDLISGSVMVKAAN